MIIVLIFFYSVCVLAIGSLIGDFRSKRSFYSSMPGRKSGHQSSGVQNNWTWRKQPSLITTNTWGRYARWSFNKASRWSAAMDWQERSTKACWQSARIMPVALFLSNGCSEGSIVRPKRFCGASSRSTCSYSRGHHSGQNPLRLNDHLWFMARLQWGAGFEHQRVNHRYHFMFRSLSDFNWMFDLDITLWIQKSEDTPKELREPGEQWNGETRNIVVRGGSLRGAASSAIRMSSTKFSKISSLSILSISICDCFLFSYYEK